MKPLVFKANSWHHRVAAEWGGLSTWQDTSDICRYTRAVLNGMGKVGLLLAMVASLLYWITITIVWWVVILQHGYFEEGGPMILSAIVILFGSAALIAEGIPWVFRKLQDYIRRKNPAFHHEKVKTDNFVTKAYRSWKEKTCVRVVFVDTTDDH